MDKVMKRRGVCESCKYALLTPYNHPCNVCYDEDTFTFTRWESENTCDTCKHRMTEIGDFPCCKCVCVDKRGSEWNYYDEEEK